MYRNDYGIADVLQLLGIPFDMPTSGRREVRIKCPYCGTKDFSVNLERSTWHCYHCGKDQDIGGGMFPLYADIRGLRDNKEAKKEIEERLFGSQGDRAYKRVEIKVKKAKDYPAKVAVRDIAYKMLVRQLPLWSKHRQALYARGLNDQDIQDGQYLTVPYGGYESIAENLIKAGVSLAHVPGFLQRSNGHWTMTNAYNSGIMIPVVDVFKRIQGIQIRFDKPMNPHNKYQWFTTAGRPQGGHARGWVHVAGSVCAKTVLLTEGSLKANVIFALSDKKPAVIAVPGVNVLEFLKPTLEIFKKNGTTAIVGAFDMDMFQNPIVLLAFFKMDELITGLGMTIRHMTWDRSYKGFDDFLFACKQKGMMPAVKKWTLIELLERGLTKYVLQSFESEQDPGKKQIWKRVCDYLSSHGILPPQTEVTASGFASQGQAKKKG